MKRIIVAILLFFPLIGFSQTYCVVPASMLTKELINNCYQTGWETIRFSADSTCILEPKPLIKDMLKPYVVEDIYLDTMNTSKWFDHGLKYYDFFDYDDMNFNQAFAKARNIGLPIFKWHGQLYTTKLEGED